MSKKIVFRTLFVFFSLLIFFYFNLDKEKRLIEKKEKIETVEKEIINNIDETIESSNVGRKECLRTKSCRIGGRFKTSATAHGCGDGRMPAG